MTAALGRSLILLCLLVSTIGAVVGFAAGRLQSRQGARWTRWFGYLFAGLMTAANLVMIYALLVHDFSVSYVAQVGSRSVPTWVTIVSLWSSLEGSILFWGLILAFFIAAAIFWNRNDHPEYMPYATAVWLACAAFFSFLIAGPASPFVTVMNPPLDGPGPNPLLQNHFLMIAHPPFLYLGYVGMTIPFGLASAALLRGRLGHDFLRPLRFWLMLPWIFLTVAIMLGGWWAYEVLGWGGYWAWDPVENASFLPWLTATAALHSAIVMERRGILKGWTSTLVLATFLLTILGTFMTRSGVFNSVHSFTQSSIGPTILVFLAITLLWTIGLLAMRIDRLTDESAIESGASKEGMFLVNNLLFVLFTFTVLIGTLFPLIVEALKGTQMSVGRPYFDKMAVPIGAALLFLMGVGPALPWGKATAVQMRRALLPPIAGGIVLLVLGLLFGVRAPWTLITLALGGFAAWVTLQELAIPALRRRSARGESLATAFKEAQLVRGRRRLGGHLVHAGAIIVIIAIAVSSTMKVSTEAQLARGESVEIGGYVLTFTGVEMRAEPHRQATIAHVDVMRGGRKVASLAPRMNQYESMREPIGTPSVHSTLSGDLYLSAMNIDVRNQSLGLMAMINPMVGWIWIAVGIMALGGFVALLPRRRSVAALSASAEAGAAGVPSRPTIGRENVVGG
ncbi:MAG TPA: heme lyase CcmF/NrfE family subunit [Thermoanaerobaculia bacterium]|nr:heme lyase CcmF/NrfE family subunit [Thermoanaerobaculia bacterium]